MPAGPPCGKTSCLVAWSLMVANCRPWLHLFGRLLKASKCFLSKAVLSARVDLGAKPSNGQWEALNPMTPMTHSSDTIRAVRTQDLDQQTRSSFGDCRGIAAGRNTDITNSRALLAGVGFVKRFFIILLLLHDAFRLSLPLAGCLDCQSFRKQVRTYSRCDSLYWPSINRF